MDYEIDKEKLEIIGKRQKAKELGKILWIITIVAGISGWYFWKWYAIPISLGLAIIIGSLYSYCMSKKVERETGLNMNEQNKVLKERGENHVFPKRLILSVDDNIRKKHGIYKNDNEEFTFNITQREQSRIEETFSQLRNKLLRPDIADEFQNMLICLSLVSLGNEYLSEIILIESMEETYERKQEVNELHESALIEYIKAFNFYEAKTILYCLANIFIKKSDFENAKELLEKYLSYKTPSDYSNDVTNLFLQYHIEMLGYESIQELDAEATNLLYNLKKSNP